MKIADIVAANPLPADDTQSTHYAWAAKVVKQNPATGRPAFRSIKIDVRRVDYEGDRPPFIFATLDMHGHSGIAHMSHLASICWRSLNGNREPDAAEKIVQSTATVMREAFLFDSLLDYARIKTAKDLGSRPEIQHRWLEELLARDIMDDYFINPCQHTPFSIWVDHLDMIQSWQAGTSSDIYDETPTYQDKTTDPERMNTLYATALVWFDLAIEASTDAKRLELASVAATAMHSASIYHGLHIAASAARRAAATHGLKGSKIAHRKTDELKSWAIEKCKYSKEQPKLLARKLVHEIPAHLVNASNSPERLIYETLLDYRKRNRMGA